MSSVAEKATTLGSVLRSPSRSGGFEFQNGHWVKTNVNAHWSKNL